MAADSTMGKVREAVNSLSGDSASGPNGFSGLFFQKCWEIIDEDVTRLVEAFLLVIHYKNSSLTQILSYYPRRRM